MRTLDLENPHAMNTTTPIHTTIVPVLSLAACNSGHLSRPNAKAQLEAMERQNQDPTGSHSVSVRIGTVSGTCYGTPDRDPVQFDTDDAMLSATGYLTVGAIKKYVWDVQLTELGNQNIVGAMGKYAHKQDIDCDSWQVTFSLSQYDHLDITGIVEDGVHAKVDITLTFRITPVGMAVRKVASAVAFENAKNEFGETLAEKFREDHSLQGSLSDDLETLPPDKDRYVKQATVDFEKYDDGWKLSTKER